ncbi:hypothetical protein ACSBR1_001372 [Camellia fascicularis]
MANVGQEVSIGDDIHSEEEEYVDPNVGGENNENKVQEVNLEANNAARGRNSLKRGNREEYYNKSDFQVWKGRCLRRDDKVKDLANKLTDLQTVVNFMMQNKMMQSMLSLPAAPTPASNADA